MGPSRTDTKQKKASEPYLRCGLPSLVPTSAEDFSLLHVCALGAQLQANQSLQTKNHTDSEVAH